MLYVADVTISQQEVTDFFYPIVSQFSFPIAISYPCKACAGGSAWGSPHKWGKHGALMRLWLWGRFSLLPAALHGSKHGSFIITLNRFIRFHLHFCWTWEAGFWQQLHAHLSDGEWKVTVTSVAGKYHQRGKNMFLILIKATQTAQFTDGQTRRSFTFSENEILYNLPGVKTGMPKNCWFTTAAWWRVTWPRICTMCTCPCSSWAQPHNLHAVKWQDSTFEDTSIHLYIHLYIY